MVAFGRFAGLVGAYNGLRGWGEKYGHTLKPAHECKDMEEMFAQLQGIEWPSDVRILLTGKGRRGRSRDIKGFWDSTDFTERGVELRRMFRAN